jgi:hypothetical protein
MGGTCGTNGRYKNCIHYELLIGNLERMTLRKWGSERVDWIQLAQHWVPADLLL